MQFKNNEVLIWRSERSSVACSAIVNVIVILSMAVLLRAGYALSLIRYVLVTQIL